MCALCRLAFLARPETSQINAAFGCNPQTVRSKSRSTNLEDCRLQSIARHNSSSTIECVTILGELEILSGNTRLNGTARLFGEKEPMAQNFDRLDATVDKLGDRVADFLERLEEMYEESKARNQRLLIGANAGGFAATLTVINSAMPGPREPRIDLAAFVVLLVFVTGLTFATLQAFLEHWKIGKALESGRKARLKVAAASRSRVLYNDLGVPEAALEPKQAPYEQQIEALQRQMESLVEGLELGGLEGMSKRSNTVFTALAGGCFAVGGVLGVALLYRLGF